MEDETTEWFEVRVLYRSGNSMTFVASNFTYERNAMGVHYSWGETRGWRPLQLGADDVEAVYYRQLDDS